MKNERNRYQNYVNTHIYKKSEQNININSLTDVIIEDKQKCKNNTKLNFFNKKTNPQKKLNQNMKNKKFNTLTVHKYIYNSPNISKQNKKINSFKNIFDKKRYSNIYENPLSDNDKEFNQKKFNYQMTEICKKFRHFNILLEREEMRSNTSNKKCPSYNTANTNLFNRLYGITEKSQQIKKQITNKNKRKNIQNYQYGLMNYISGKVSRDNCADLVHEFRKIRDDTEIIKPLPKINFQNLISHSIDQSHHKLINNKLTKDDYEKDLFVIKNHKVMAQKQNSKSYQETYRMNKILPEHIVHYLLKIRKIV